MILPKADDAIHKSWMYKLLTAIADDSFLANNLRFKGGTCAAMRGFIERFSVDLDFDLIDQKQNLEIQKHLERIFQEFDLEIKDHSKKVPQYFLKYPGEIKGRNTIAMDITFPPPKSNDYEPVSLIEIDRILHCHTIPTMFANKLVSITDRYQKHGSIAGRDIFDIHTFFMKGFELKEEIIMERTGKPATEFLWELKEFIIKNFTQTIIDQDLNTLLPYEKFKKLRTTLKREVLTFL